MHGQKLQNIDIVLNKNIIYFVGFIGLIVIANRSGFVIYSVIMHGFLKTEFYFLPLQVTEYVTIILYYQIYKLNHLII